MKIDNLLCYLKHPDTDENPRFVIENNHLLDKNSDRKYPIISQMIDFTGIHVEADGNIHNRKGIMFRLNNMFSRHIDGRILMSVFAAGGIGFSKANKKIKTWIKRIGIKPTLLLDPEDKTLLSFIGEINSLSVEDLTRKNLLPDPENYPDINASMVNLPIKSNAFENIVSYFVIEHVINPHQHIKELARMVKPGGYIILAGPGDVYPSHRVPYNYFNVTRFGYYEMLRENGLELIEEYYPAKSWVSILYLCYTTVVRNSLYNKNQATKFFHMVVFILSVCISPLLNAIFLLLDRITPFDKRIYMLYLALLRKKIE
jgi:SAM-dependent methyltransferase